MKLRYSVALLGLWFAVGADNVMAREIVDMAGRAVTVADTITKVYAAQPYTYALMSVVAPDLMVGLPGPLSETDKRFVRPEVAALPVLGSGMGPGAQTNLEAVLALQPNFALLKGGPGSDTRAAVEKFAKVSLPVVFVDIDRIDDYAAAIEFAGRLLGRETRALELAIYARNILADVDRVVSAIPEDQRVRVYYAEGPDGLATECNQSFHADAIRRAGGVIVHQCLLSQHVGMEKVSLEQVIAYNPDVVVASDVAFAKAVRGDARWQGIRAVAQGRVYTVPRSPFNWIDRPPSIMRLMGVPWLAHRFYPDRYAVDIRTVTRDFQRRFFGVIPSETDLDALLN